VKKRKPFSAYFAYYGKRSAWFCSSPKFTKIADWLENCYQIDAVFDFLYWVIDFSPKYGILPTFFLLFSDFLLSFLEKVVKMKGVGRVSKWF